MTKLDGEPGMAPIMKQISGPRWELLDKWCCQFKAALPIVRRHIRATSLVPD